VTTTAATPRLHASRIICITASLFVESSAPEGSSAKRRWHGPGDRHPLALAAGELVRVVVGPISEAELLEGSDACAIGPSCWVSVELEGQRDVLGGGQTWEQIEVLEHVADCPPAKPRLVVAGQG
jgi:hypothetical protein